MLWWGWVLLSALGAGLVLVIGIGLGMAAERQRVLGLLSRTRRIHGPVHLALDEMVRKDVRVKGGADE